MLKLSADVELTTGRVHHHAGRFITSRCRLMLYLLMTKEGKAEKVNEEFSGMLKVHYAYWRFIIFERYERIELARARCRYISRNQLHRCSCTIGWYQDRACERR